MGWKRKSSYDGKKDAIIATPPMKVFGITGAGDILNGGFIAGLAKGMDFIEAVRYGTIVAGLSVARFGNAPPIP